MKQFYTVVLDRITEFQGLLESEPYEVGWANEAIFFVRIHAMEKGAVLDGKVQISADGIQWVDEGTQIIGMSAVRSYCVKVTHFGGWLRFVLTGPVAKQCTVTTYLVLKG